MIHPRLLAVFSGNNSEPPSVETASLPSKIEVGYVPPNADGTRKNCRNCWKWIQGLSKCLEMRSDALVLEDMICTAHNFGQPTPAQLMIQHPGNLEPDMLGLMVARTGTSCDTCIAFDGGVCRAVQDDGQPALVEPLACCNRYISRE